MWFPYRDRHEYLIVSTTRDYRIAFFAAIKQVTFHRRDFTAICDQDFYIETFDDTAQTAINEFQQLDWRFVVP